MYVVQWCTACVESAQVDLVKIKPALIIPVTVSMHAVAAIAAVTALL
jgi:hypothetical protein